jgi:actin-related protein
MGAISQISSGARSKIRRGRFTVPQSVMESKVFDQVIKDIIGLVKDQIRATRSFVSAVLLVGGFGQSGYLMSRIQAKIDSHTPVMMPHNGWTAVVRGGAMIGLDHARSTDAGVNIVSRTARHHYGVWLSHSYNRKVHSSREK